MKINILGTEYQLEYRDIKDDPMFEKVEAYTDTYIKLIIIGNIEQRESFRDDNICKIKTLKNKIVRHEIVHAFLYESGLDANSSDTIAWADNEEMVDWFAIQSPKIFKVYKELNIL